ncbi:YaaA family protein [Arsenicicoccus cauae]|uniref:Peroxide stress protein YaaA n=1 Tax=Arsenicicoccus cauae TaxID=2663847 RepID=A0A6I3IFG8_9MICO|nr:peroxide stress protein YaaA [Arsenicicoccus cauae]MTB72772.1 peroxide stress protein YaaA [Arsenicicoccus cauae]
MLILLPPSESKSSRPRGRAWRPESLSWPELTPSRLAVARELERVSAREDAPATLGVSRGLADEIARNLHLDTAPAVPVSELYAGVLYDALDLASLDAAGLRRARRFVVVQSALHGALRLSDRVAPYRLSMGVRLGALGPLATWWRPRVEPLLAGAAGSGLVVDCRSSTYAAAWPPAGELARRWVQVRVPGATHMAKHTRGLVTRAICELGTTPRTPRALADALSATFDVTLEPPARVGRPFVLDTSPR